MEPGTMNGAEEAGSRKAPYVTRGDRRIYKEWFKAQVAQECLAPGALISVVAQRHNINTNVLFRWRREFRLGLLRPAQTENFVSAGVIGPGGKVLAAKAKKRRAVKAAPRATPALRPVRHGVVELYLSGRVKIRIQGEVNKDMLGSILAAVREIA
jgi:transposase